MSGTLSYLQVQSAFDVFFPDGGRYYMKSHFLNELTDEAIVALLDCDARLRRSPTQPADADHHPHPRRRDHQGQSRAERVPAPIGPVQPQHRPPQRSEPALDDAAIGWARSTWDALRPFATGGAYVNFAGLGDEADELRDAAAHRP